MLSTSTRSRLAARARCAAAAAPAPRLCYLDVRFDRMRARALIELPDE